ncbi:hypothetical protein CRG98_037734 [Punica granatum]|uniref:Uncharacterized protein n=1 Tax=Punica granatum TaxID=22663 RepID=A0A2I0ICZ9_PUNGR|nr:hypothetical protein CRG98_037734 [Punica granatum]
MDGGSPSGVVTSPKQSEDRWGPVRWQSRLDPFPYSEPPSNLASYWLPVGFSSVGLHARDRIAQLACVHLPGERVTNTREKASPLPVYNPKVEGWRVAQV